MADLPERKEYLQLRQSRDRRFQVIPARRDLDRQRLVLRRQAFDRVEDDRPLELQPVRRIAAILALGQADLQLQREGDLWILSLARPERGS